MGANNTSEEIERLLLEILYLAQCLENEPIRKAIIAAANLGLAALELRILVTN